MRKALSALEESKYTMISLKKDKSWRISEGFIEVRTDSYLLWSSYLDKIWILLNEY